MLNLSQNGCSVWVTSSTQLALTPTAVALGKFDGIHRGHQRVIQPILKAEDEVGMEGHKDTAAENIPASSRPSASASSQASSTDHIYSTVVTFDPHPQEFFTGQPRSLLTPLDEKVQQLRSLGVEQLVLLPFDKELCALTPEEFVEKILIKQLQATQISVGQDFRFGSGRRGTAEDLQVIAAKYGIPVTIVPLEISKDGEDNNQENRISSSLIRDILIHGDIQNANKLLGRPYTLIGTVIQGQKLGRTIGFPTANLLLPKDKLVPNYGVYAVRVFMVNETLDRSENVYLGVMNIGNRPTVNGTHLSVEVHIFNYSDDLYGKKLAVQLEKFLRPEQKFPNLEALKAQIQLDCHAAQAFFATEC